MSGFQCFYCKVVFETRRQQWDHTSTCPVAKQAMRDLRAYAGLDEDDES